MRPPIHRVSRRPRRRFVVVLVVALLVPAALACGGSPGSDTATRPPAEPAPPAGQPDGPPGGPSSTTAASTPASAPPDDTTVPATPGDTPAGADPAGPPGSLATAVLGARAGDRITLELLQQEGAALRGSTLEHLAGVLAEVSGKEVAATATRVVPGGARRWTAGGVRTAVDAHGVSRHGDGQVVIRLLIVHGEWADDPSALGVAVRGDTAAVFGDRIEASGSLLVPPAAIEKAVATHEVGHLLGLVDLVLDTGRGDPEHPHHSPNRESVMYWAVETDAIARLLEGGPPTDFDAADRADLAELRRRGG